MNKMKNKKSPAEVRSGSVMGNRAWTDARVPQWHGTDQISGLPSANADGPGAARVDERVAEGSDDGTY